MTSSELKAEAKYYGDQYRDADNSNKQLFLEMQVGLEIQAHKLSVLERLGISRRQEAK
jgi:hypothetical protein